MKLSKKTILFLLVLLVLSPAGLILPEILRSGCAWGEWGLDEISQILGYVPEGIAKLSNLWHPVLPDYNLPLNNGNNMMTNSLSYIFSGLIGSFLCYAVSILVLKLGSTLED